MIDFLTSHAGAGITGLLLFLGFFFVVLLKTFVIDSKESHNKFANIPLMEDSE